MDFVHPIESVVPGAQGRILAVLAETSGELSLRSLARLAHVSPAQASRVLPDLVALGIVERRDVPPSHLYRLVPEHVAAAPLLALARCRDAVLVGIGRLAASLPIPPDLVLVFGSLARGEASIDSDVDLLVVRPDGRGEDAPEWGDAVEELRVGVRRLTGNPAAVLELDADEVDTKLGRGRGVWASIRRDAVVVHGREPAALRR